MRPRRIAAVPLVSVLAAVLMVGGVASAAFSAGPPNSTTVISTLSVAPVTNLSATASCGPPLSLTAKVVLTWTSSVTASVTGYEIRRRIAPTAASAVGTTSAAASTYTDSSLLTATGYSYVVRAYRGTWFTDSAEVTVTTPAVCT